MSKKSKPVVVSVAQQILTWIGSLAEDHEAWLLRIADSEAEKMLHSKRGGALIADGSDHYATFARIAKQVDGSIVREAHRDLKQRDAEHIQRGASGRFPSDVASNFWVPQMCAAYYLGIAIGLRFPIVPIAAAKPRGANRRAR